MFKKIFCKHKWGNGICIRIESAIIYLYTCKKCGKRIYKTTDYLYSIERKLLEDWVKSKITAKMVAEISVFSDTDIEDED